MIKLLPLLLIALGVYLMVRFSAARMGRSLRARSRPLENDRLDRVLSRLAGAAGIERVEVRVLDDPSINGLATPGGEIYVTQGLVRQFQARRIGEAELAAVVAHELGHLALGHTRRRMIDVSAAQTAGMILGTLLARVIPIVGWYIAQFLIGLFVTGLSRRDEFEADAYATALMLRSGLGAEAQARMLEALQTLVPGASQAPTASWLASHPPVEERTAAIRANALRWSQQERSDAGDAGPA
ncbi:MAG: M48 family metallopeptidase [Paracoccaceae bacterium]